MPLDISDDVTAHREIVWTAVKAEDVASDAASSPLRIKLEPRDGAGDDITADREIIWTAMKAEDVASDAASSPVRVKLEPRDGAGDDITADREIFWTAAKAEDVASDAASSPLRIKLEPRDDAGNRGGCEQEHVEYAAAGGYVPVWHQVDVNEISVKVEAAEGIADWQSEVNPLLLPDGMEAPYIANANGQCSASGPYIMYAIGQEEYGQHSTSGLSITYAIKQEDGQLYQEPFVASDYVKAEIDHSSAIYT